MVPPTKCSSGWDLPLKSRGSIVDKIVIDPTVAFAEPGEVLQVQRLCGGHPDSLISDWLRSFAIFALNNVDLQELIDYSVKELKLDPNAPGLVTPDVLREYLESVVFHADHGCYGYYHKR